MKMKMMKKRTDRNQAEVVKFLRDHGYYVIDIHEIGKGVPDILVSGRYQDISVCVLVEIKSPGEGRLNQQQLEFLSGFPGPVVVAYSAEDCLSKLLKIGVFPL